MGVFLQWDVLHNQADRIDDMTMRITSCEGASGLLRVAASSNAGFGAGEAPQQLSGIGDKSFCPLWTMLHGPYVCIPAFTGPSGMPMGLQIVGPLNSDDRTIAISAWIAEALSMLPQ